MLPCLGKEMSVLTHVGLLLPGKLAREIAEQQRINRMGGIGNLENARNPMGGRPGLYNPIPTIGESAAVGGAVGAGLGAVTSGGNCP